MTPAEPRIGHTYRVRIPRHESPAKYVTGRPGRGAADLMFLQLAFAHGDGLSADFDITLTSVGEELAGEPAVTGVKVVDTTHVSTPLAPQVAAALGLSPDVEYVVEGVLRDARSGEPVQVLAEETLTIPVSWLHE
ncbi:hypothetical protein [Allokutzneria albata]|uniref:Uncharacterized protein n=1 Tax=Allokutzneria albata TaxID=211114 RepID=A0A1G9Y2J1_ALLAB|nr:hypothetical protein [Allokutzneria albata]SDN03299.1 hypothetical protein SAMN04489726_4559 [Allokutzneria albata]